MSAAPLLPRPQTSPPCAGLDDELGSIERSVTCIVGLAEARRSSTDSRELRYPLDRAAYSVLCRIEEASSIRLTELAVTMGIDLSTASRQVRALEERGLVARTGDPDDQRTKRLDLTEQGLAALDDARALRISTLRSRLSSWPEDDLTELARLLERFVDSVEMGRSPDAALGTDRDADASVNTLASAGSSHRLAVVGGSRK